MREKYLLLFFGLILISSSLVVADSTYYEEDYSLVTDSSDVSYMEVAKLRYEPYPVSPGDYFTIWIQVEKSGSGNKDATFELVEEYPFTLDDNEDAIREISSLGSEAVALEYQVRVDDDAVAGYNTLKLRQSLEGTATIISEFDIYVYDVQTSFDAVVQDNDDGELSIALANVGQNDADAAIVRVPEQDGVTVSGTNGQMIGNLEQGDYTIVGFTTTSSASSVVIQIDYTDIIGVRRTEYIEVPLSSSYDSVLLNSSNPFGNRSDMGEMPGNGSSSWVKWVVIVLVLATVIYFGRKYYLEKHSASKHDKKKAGSPSWVDKHKGK